MAALLHERCQFENTVYRYLPPFGGLRRIRRALRRLPDAYAPRPGLGKPSRFTPGEWVRVLDTAAIGGTLNERGMLRGLSFTKEQWTFCGGVYRVESVVRRMMNDAGLMRPIARSVTLAGVMCDGLHREGGCGRACPLLFRDEWLEPAEAPAQADPADSGPRYARVKALPEILATLDGGSRRDGVVFAPAMARFSGGTFAVHKQVQPVAATWWRRPAGEWYILSGVRCLGEQLGTEGPCHRGCGLLWHRDWLDFD